MVESSLSLSLAMKGFVVAQLMSVGVSPVLSSICFTGNSYKNASGHWNLEATITHKDVDERDPEFSLGTRRWSYNVEVTTLKSGDENSMQVVFKTTAPPHRVGSDYSFFPGFGYYKFHDTWINWEEAKKKCESEGTHLMIINSNEEVEIFKKLIAKIDKAQNWVHVGFHDRFREGEYTTVLGTPLDSTGYTRWLTGEPSNVDTQNCGGATVGKAMLVDNKCSDGGNFICEQELW